MQKNRKENKEKKNSYELIKLNSNKFTVKRKRKRERES